MGSYIDKGFYDDSDPIYQEGFTIMIPLGINRKPKKDSEESRESSSQKKSANKQSEKKKILFNIFFKNNILHV